jgi:5-methylcytosine-specific restriction enzyme B
VAVARWTGAEEIYEIADLFRERCLADERSLLWPEVKAWTPSNLQAIWDALVRAPSEGEGAFVEKWREQLAGMPDDAYRVAADLTVLYNLFPSNIGPGNKRRRVREVIDWKLGDDEVPELLEEIDDAFETGIGNAGTSYSIGRPWQIAYFLQFAIRLQAEDIDPYDPEACAWLAGDVRGRIKGSAAARHILLHLLFPDQFERIASDAHRRRIVAVFAEEAASAGVAASVDAQLLTIRAALTERFGTHRLDFYRGDIKVLWDREAEVETNRPAAGAADDEYGDKDAASFDALVAATHLDPRELHEFDQLLRERRQIIFEGPPGSGKTYVAELFARWFVGLPLGGPPDDRLEIIQFHQTFDYEDFVQGIRPETDLDGHLRYRVSDGIFTNFCTIAARQPDRRFVLVIDEINRGNVARIFGELLLLLEYRDKRARLPYAPAEAGDDAYLSIPDNLYLIGTMNSTDRTVSSIDHAMRRRFYFCRFLPVENGQAPVLDGWLAAKGIGLADRRRVVRTFVALNRRVQERLSADFEVGHSYFMVPDIATPAGLDRVWRRAVRPLLEQYFHDAPDRDALLAELAPSHQD